MLVSQPLTQPALAGVVSVRPEIKFPGGKTTTHVWEILLGQGQVQVATFVVYRPTR